MIEVIKSMVSDHANVLMTNERTSNDGGDGDSGQEFKSKMISLGDLSNQGYIDLYVGYIDLCSFPAKPEIGKDGKKSSS